MRAKYPDRYRKGAAGVKRHFRQKDNSMDSELSTAHAHHHSPEEKKRQISRLNRIIGHLEYVKRMIENDEDCAEVLTQIAASRSALNGLGKQIIKEHISHCIIHAVEDGDTTAIDEFQKAIEKYM